MGTASMMEAADARATLESLRDVTAAADPYQPAPQHWIAELHAALNAVAPPEHVQVHRLDGLHGINMSYLNRRVRMVLEKFDSLVRGDP